MFETLKAQPADKILALVQAYREDPRDTKIDLGVGVYKDASGNTPVMRAVKAAEQRIWESQDTKVYTGLAGDPAYADAMAALVLGDAVPRGSVAAAATPGGTGAVRQAFELVKMANPQARVFVSNPTWPNHLSILKLSHYLITRSKSKAPVRNVTLLNLRIMVTPYRKWGTVAVLNSRYLAQTTWSKRPAVK